MFILSPETVNTLALFVGLVIVSIYNHLRAQKAEKRANERQNAAESRSAANTQGIQAVSNELTETKEALETAQASIKEMQKNLELKQQTIDADSKAITNVVKENQQLHEMRETDTQRITALENEISQAKTSLTELRLQMDTATGERDKAVLDLTEERRLSHESQEKLESANKRIAELEGQVRQLETKTAALEMIFSRLQIVVTTPSADTASQPVAAPPVVPTSEVKPV